MSSGRVWRVKIVSGDVSGRSRRRPLISVEMVLLGLGVVGRTIGRSRGVVVLQRGGATFEDSSGLCESVDALSRKLPAGEEIR